MSSPYFTLKDYTYSCYMQKEHFFSENISAFILVIQNTCGRKNLISDTMTFSRSFSGAATVAVQYLLKAGPHLT